ncbi:MTAP family purine nucleoside phosphorylase [Neobacillus soli]|uniref:MTAP family purine nucleoside phosphorylase n=1 Tax=Neobacillus soli TaxID=220688 RepID=UPI0008264129|nr:MTAP family purine nucleoside phosphorylase [Neobacillus soli]
MKIGLIGGTGFYDLFDSLEEIEIETDYGKITLFKSHYAGNEIYFLPRHGTGHGVLAPDVNYKGNIMALKKTGVNQIIAVSAVGSINREIPVGGLSLLNQFVDFTRRRSTSYGQFSADITDPFCPKLQETIKQAAGQIEQKIYEDTTLICVDGPIYETRNELQVFASWGMDVVGMTNSTEAVLTRELGMCFSVVTLSTDIATGTSDVPPDLATHKRVAESNKHKVKQLILKTLENFTGETECKCGQSFNKANLSYKFIGRGVLSEDRNHWRNRLL